MPLVDVIKRVRAGDWEEGQWFFFAGDADDLTLQTDADLGFSGYDEDTDEEVYPLGFRERGLWISIEAHTLESSIKWADQLAGKVDDDAAVKVIRYYVRFDAWPEKIDSPDPLPPDQARLLLARKFYDALGEERMGTQCKIDGCNRGAIKLSVFCRRHHFEKLRNEPCPFDD